MDVDHGREELRHRAGVLRSEDIEVETVLVHDGSILQHTDIFYGLRTDGGPVHGIVGLPASVGAGRHQPELLTNEKRVLVLLTNAMRREYCVVLLTNQKY